MRDHYEERASSYDRVIRLPEALLFADGRRWACEQAEGRVLELAAGTERNLPYYREDVRLTAIELSPVMLGVAHERAKRLGRPDDLRVGDAEALDFPDERFDTVVATLALCPIPDDRRAVAEARRVLRPGGRLVLLEHVRSPATAVRAVQQLLDPLIRFECGHLLREPLDHVRAERPEVESCQRSKWGLVKRLVARKPLPRLLLTIVALLGSSEGLRGGAHARPARRVMKKTRRVVSVVAIAAAVGVFGAGYGVAAAQDEPRNGRPRAPESDEMQQLHERMVRDPQMRRMHEQMTRDPEMRRMHDQMMRMHEMMGNGTGMGMPGRGRSEMGGRGHMGG